VTETTTQFRERARAWLAENADSFDHNETPEAARANQALIFRGGFAGIGWPREYGGQGLTTTEQRAWDEEVQSYGVHLQHLNISMGLVGPTVLELGTEAQKLRILPPILRGETVSCQLFSEPSAGSDLAGLRTRARPDGGGWVVDGQKVWTTHAHVADLGVLLARTDPDVPKHKGITMFVVDMTSPGIEVRPLRDMTGATKFNEVFFDGLRLPGDAVLGAVGQGWDATVRMLKHERMHITTRMRRDDDPSSYAMLAREVKARGLDTDPVVRRTLAEVFVGQRVGELFSARIAEEIKEGREPGPRGSIGKLADARQVRMLASAVTTLLGSTPTSWEAGDTRSAALSQIITSAPRNRLAGGTDEIQRTIISERVLGLPKEQS